MNHPIRTVLIGLTLMVSGIACSADRTAADPLSPADASQYSGTEPVEVQGFIVLEPDSARLCTALAETSPPRCGGPGIDIDGLDPATLDQRWPQQTAVTGNLDHQVRHRNRDAPRRNPAPGGAVVTATALIVADDHRAAGLASTLGGLLMIIDAALHLTVDDTYTPQTLLRLPHEVWHLPGMAGILLTLFGLIGIHARQHPATSRQGSIGFALVIVGIVAGAAYSTVFHGVFLPAIDDIAQQPSRN